MNYGTFIKISLILAIIATISACIFKPKMHNRVFVYDSEYKIAEQKIETVVEKNIPEVKIQPETERKQNQVINQRTPEVQTQKITTVKQAKTNKVLPVTEVKKTQVNNKVLTESQEEIEWNIWRSNLQNQIMKDVRLPIIPQGTVFKFEFDVDMYGKISNVQTWSYTSSYTPYAIQYIAPVIRSYQGHSILNFPKGSNRTQTHVKGGWKIAESVRYSTPKDYNDTEKIKK